jgi:hypothetical protein
MAACYPSLRQRDRYALFPRVVAHAANSPVCRVTGQVAHNTHEDGVDIGFTFLGRPQWTHCLALNHSEFPPARGPNLSPQRGQRHNWMRNAVKTNRGTHTAIAINNSLPSWNTCEEIPPRIAIAGTKPAQTKKNWVLNFRYFCQEGE